MAFWGDDGISEEASLSVCKFCDLPATQFEQPTSHDSAQMSGAAAEGLQPWHHRHLQRRRRRRNVGQLGHVAGRHETMPERSADDYDDDGAMEEEQEEREREGGTAASRSHHLGLRDEGLGRGGAQTDRRRLREEGAVECNKPQRVLIQNGTVFLTSLVAAEWLGPFEHIGFLVELYEASQVGQGGGAFCEAWGPGDGGDDRACAEGSCGGSVSNFAASGCLHVGAVTRTLQKDRGGHASGCPR